jgi:hypothetical protein
MRTGFEDKDIDGEDVPAALRKVASEVRFHSFRPIYVGIGLAKILDRCCYGHPCWLKRWTVWAFETVLLALQTFGYLDDMVKLSEAPPKLFGKIIIPYPKNTDDFWWAVLLSAKPFKSIYKGDLALISPVSVNTSQTPQEEARLLGRERLLECSLDAEYVLNDDIEPRMLTTVQLNPTANFLDKTVYKQVVIEEWKFGKYLMDHKLCFHRCEVPMFLGYSVNVFGYGIKKCVQLQEKVNLRNVPANLLLIDKKTLTSSIDMHGKVFVVAEQRDLSPDELKEIVIFCMGQAETSELKYTSWERLKDRLQEEARKFAMSAQHLSPPKYTSKAC